MKSAFQGILSDERERNVCHEGDSFIYLHSHHTVGLPLSNKSVEKIRWTI